MGCSTQRPALTAAAVLALVLATARGFVLAPAGCHHRRHPLHPTTTTATTTNRLSGRAPRRTASPPVSFSLVPSSSSQGGTCFTGCPATVAHPVSSTAAPETVGGIVALRPSCCSSAATAVSRTTTKMGLGLASCLMPGAGRKVWCTWQVVVEGKLLSFFLLCLLVTNT